LTLKSIKALYLAFLFCCTLALCHAQKPKDGTYTYAIAWAEWGGKTLGATCTVIIKGDRIKVIHNGNYHEAYENRKMDYWKKQKRQRR
jgi:hypothetical protein